MVETKSDDNNLYVINKREDESSIFNSNKLQYFYQHLPKINEQVPKTESIINDYQVPTNPIMNNPNVIRSAPVNFANSNPFFMPSSSTNINVNMNNPNYPNGYFNNLVNPYTGYVSGLNFLPQKFSYPYSKLNFISSNFQGKIPMSYGMNPINPINQINPMTNYGLKNTGMINQNYNNGPGFNPSFSQVPHINNGNAYIHNQNNFNNSAHLNNGFEQPPEPEPEKEVEQYHNDKTEDNDIQIEKIN